MSSARYTSIARSAKAGTGSGTASLINTAPAGTVVVALPEKVIEWEEEVTIADPASRSAIDAAPIVSGAVPNAFEKTTRSASPLTVACTISRSVWLLGTSGGTAGPLPA